MCRWDYGCIEGFSIPRHSDTSLNSGLNTEGVSIARLPRKTRKKRVGRYYRSSRLDPKNNPDSISTQVGLNNIVSKYGFPPNVEVRLPRPGEKVDSPNGNWTCFYVVPFHLGLNFLLVVPFGIYWFIITLPPPDLCPTIGGLWWP